MSTVTICWLDTFICSKQLISFHFFLLISCWETNVHNEQEEETKREQKRERKANVIQWMKPRFACDVTNVKHILNRDTGEKWRKWVRERIFTLSLYFSFSRAQMNSPTLSLSFFLFFLSLFRFSFSLLLLHLIPSLVLARNTTVPLLVTLVTLWFQVCHQVPWWWRYN